MNDGNAAAEFVVAYPSIGNTGRPWYPLDTTALIFPPLISPRTTTLFRISARLHAPVRVSVLQEALDRLYRRAPYCCVRLRWGFFWYYLEQCSAAPVLSDEGAPCMDFPQRRVDRPLAVVRARGCRIALEASHVLTDGVGALTFLKTLVVLYDEVLHGRPVDRGEGILPAEGPEEWETCYANRRFFRPGRPHPPVFTPAWHLPGQRVPPGRYRITTGRYSLADLRGNARGLNVSITDFCLAVFIYTLQERYLAAPERGRRRRPIRILVPVDMRPGTGVKTMRNFFVFAMVEIDQRLGKYELDEIARNVHHQLRAQLDTRSLQKQISRSVGARRNWFNRIIPIGLKNMILRGLYLSRGEAVNTASFSNLGAVDLPDTTAGMVRDFDFLPPPSPVTGLNMTLISFGDTVSVSFGSSREAVEVERGFFRVLAGIGMHGRLITNWGD